MTGNIPTLTATMPTLLEQQAAASLRVAELADLQTEPTRSQLLRWAAGWAGSPCNGFQGLR